MQDKNYASITLLDKFSNSNPNQLRTQLSFDVEESIRSNLEYLLNTHKPVLYWPAVWRQLTASLLNYGLEDFTQLSFLNRQNCAEFCAQLTKTILQFEPRFKTVQVKILAADTTNSGQLKLCITGLVALQPAAICINYNSFLKPMSLGFSIKFENNE
jgi:type VI secretion system protein ImpF